MKMSNIKYKNMTSRIIEKDTILTIPWKKYSNNKRILEVFINL